MDFDWLIPVITAIMIYACIYYAIKKYHFMPNVFDFMGPCIMIKTKHTGIFDKLSKPKKLLIAYADTGVILTAICAVCVTLLFVVTAYLTLIVHPEPTEVQNLLLIPGVNEYVPSTFAVWFSIVFAMVIHECGHGILSRAEDIKVKSAGLLTLVIPIGAFVEPDEKDVEAAPLRTKLRMFAAGITNNLFAGTICLVILILLLGMIVPGTSPYIYGIYDGYPAQDAGVPAGMAVTSIDGVNVKCIGDISDILNKTSPGQTVTISGTYKSKPCSYDITLTSIPSDKMTNVIQDTSGSGFAGISFSQPSMITDALYKITHPKTPINALSSFTSFIVLPFSSITGFNMLSFISADTPDSEILSAPFFGFWEIIHLLFWCAWLNILLGIFNALPAGIFDGGQMLRESMRAWFVKHGKDENTAFMICSTITYMLIVIIIIPILMPYLF